MKNFLEHFRQVGIRLKQFPVSMAALALYNTLMQYNNDLYWVDEFTAANRVLEAYADMSETTLMKARSELVQKGYISYKKGTTRQAGSYKIIDYSSTRGNPGGNSRGNPGGNPGGNSRGNPGDIKKTIPVPDQNIPPNPQEGEPPAAGEEKKSKRFVPPTVEEVAAYCQERNNGISAEAFVAFYASKGWKVGNQKMKSWRQAVITWEQKRKQESSPAPQKSYDPTQDFMFGWGGGDE